MSLQSVETNPATPCTTSVPSIFMFKDVVEVRTLTINDAVWFVASDVAKALGYVDDDRVQTTNMIRLLDDDESVLHNVKHRSDNGVEQMRGMTIISESGLYHAIFNSQKEEAKAFRRWVTEDVLPSIHRIGRYDHAEYLALQEKYEVLEGKNEDMRSRNNELHRQMKDENICELYQDNQSLNHFRNRCCALEEELARLKALTKGHMEPSLRLKLERTVADKAFSKGYRQALTHFRESSMDLRRHLKSFDKMVERVRNGHKPCEATLRDVQYTLHAFLETLWPDGMPDDAIDEVLQEAIEDAARNVAFA